MNEADAKSARKAKTLSLTLLSMLASCQLCVARLDRPRQQIVRTWVTRLAVAWCVVGHRVLVQLLQVGPAEHIKAQGERRRHETSATAKEGMAIVQERGVQLCMRCANSCKSAAG